MNVKIDLKALKHQLLERGNFQAIHVHFRIVTAKIKVTLRLKLWSSLMKLLEIIQNLLHAGSNYNDNTKSNALIVLSER